MPNIKIYNAPQEKLITEDRGFSAFETAGRRIGPAYNEAAHLITGGGKLEEEAIINQADQQDKLSKQVMQQYRDLWELSQNAAARKSSGGGGGFNTKGGGSGGGSRGSGGGGGSGMGDISNGAANLTNALAGKKKEEKGGKLYEPPDPMKGSYYEPEVFKKILDDLTPGEPPGEGMKGYDPLKGNYYDPTDFRHLISGLTPGMETDEQDVEREINRNDAGIPTSKHQYDLSQFPELIDRTIKATQPTPDAPPSNVIERSWNWMFGKDGVFSSGTEATPPEQAFQPQSQAEYNPEMDQAARAASEAGSNDPSVDYQQYIQPDNSNPADSVAEDIAAEE